MYNGEERRGFFGIACGNPSPSLEAQDGVFHEVAHLIDVSIVNPWFSSVLFGRNDRRHDLLLGLCQNGIRVISLVGQEVIGLEARYKVVSLCAIRNGTCCNKHSERHTMRIHGQVYLGVEPPFVRAMA